VSKNGTSFWKCWKSKFKGGGQCCKQINGLTNDNTIVNKFADYFTSACTSFSAAREEILKEEYLEKRSVYSGFPFTDEYLFSVDLVEKIVTQLKRCKAAGLDKLMAEHIQYSHPVLISILAKLFNLIMLFGQVPTGFGLSYTVPLPKSDDARGKPLSVEDFRGISISPILSKIFEHCILDRFKSFFVTSDNQFGFKKGLSCSHAVYAARKAVDYYISGGSTVNLCALDLSKAFDKLSHSGLFIKLMNRNLPISLLNVLENWFSISFTCVKWGSIFSSFFLLNSGVRQGGVLSPYLFALYVDDIVKKIRDSSVGCHLSYVCTSILLYADDILLISPSVYGLQLMLKLCEDELDWLNMHINAKKSMCLRIGPRYDAPCSHLTTSNGHKLEWVNICRYLGVYLVSARNFKVDLERAKASVYRAFNAIFGKVSRLASEEVILHLIQSKCIPILLYGLEACPINSSQKHSLEFPITKIFMKLFRTYSPNIVKECQIMFGFLPVTLRLALRKANFLDKLRHCPNSLCSIILAASSKDELDSLCAAHGATDARCLAWRVRGSFFGTL
jgi:hypothetical protein